MQRLNLGAVALLALATATSAVAEPLPNWETHVICSKDLKDKSKGECMGLEVDAWDFLSKKWDRLPVAQRKDCLLPQQKPGEESYRKLKGCADKHIAALAAEDTKKAEAAAAAAKAKADAAAAAAAKAKADAAAAEAKKLADAEAAKKAAAAAQTVAAPAEDPEAEKKRAAERAAESKRWIDLYAPLDAAWNKEQASDFAASVKQADAEMMAWRKADAAERAKAAEVKPAPAPAEDPEAEKKRAAERAAESKRWIDLYAPLEAAWNKEQSADYAASVKQADAEMMAWRKADAAERAKAAEVKPAPVVVAAPAEDPEAEKKRAAERAAESKRWIDLYAPLTTAWNKEQASDYAASVKQADAEMMAWRKADAAERAKAAEVKPAPAPVAVATPPPATPAAPAPDVRKAEAQACQAKLRDVAKAGTILFATGKADINPKSQTTINDLAAAAKGCPGLKIRVEGHTDGQGEVNFNQTLSENRAKAIADALAKAGVEQARLDAVGFGETKPVAPNDSSDNRAKNRRIEFVVE